jgi:CheY-like chemotaxis protein
MTEADDGALPYDAELPVLPGGNDSAKLQTPSPPESPPASLLLVEDEAVLAMDLAFMLQDMGYRVCATADRSDDAVALAHAHRPDLVLMDIVIKGGVDGIETSRRIAQEIGIPVIFLTAYSDAETVSRAAETAPYGYITKPY